MGDGTSLITYAAFHPDGAYVESFGEDGAGIGVWKPTGAHGRLDALHGGCRSPSGRHCAGEVAAGHRGGRNRQHHDRGGNLPGVKGRRRRHLQRAGDRPRRLPGGPDRAAAGNAGAAYSRAAHPRVKTLADTTRGQKHHSPLAHFEDSGAFPRSCRATWPGTQSRCGGNHVTIR